MKPMFVTEQIKPAAGPMEAAIGLAAESASSLGRAASESGDAFEQVVQRVMRREARPRSDQASQPANDASQVRDAIATEHRFLNSKTSPSHTAADAGETDADEAPLPPSKGLDPEKRSPTDGPAVAVAAMPSDAVQKRAAAASSSSSQGTSTTDLVAATIRSPLAQTVSQPGSPAAALSGLPDKHATVASAFTGTQGANPTAAQNPAESVDPSLLRGLQRLAAPTSASASSESNLSTPQASPSTGQEVALPKVVPAVERARAQIAAHLAAAKQGQQAAHTDPAVALVEEALRATREEVSKPLPANTGKHPRGGLALPKAMEALVDHALAKWEAARHPVMSGGMTGAEFSDWMKKVLQASPRQDVPEQRLPQTAILDLDMPEAHNAVRAVTAQPAVLAADAAHQQTAAAPQTVGEVESQPPIHIAIDRAELQARILENAVTLRRQGQNQLDVVYRPERGTELQMNLTLREGQVVVEALLRRGDPANFQALWPELQRNLAQHGVRLEALQHPQSHLSDSPTGQFAQRQAAGHSDAQSGGREGQPWPHQTSQQAPEQPRPAPTAARHAAKPNATGRSWETWA